MRDEDKLLTVREVARSCSRSEETVRRWIWSGKLPARKLGNQLFVSSEELLRIGGEADGALPKSRRPYTKEEILRQIEEDERFSDEMLEKYGLIDAVELVRQVREGDD